MQLKNQKKLAAKILKCSPKKIKIDGSSLEEVKKCITRDSIRHAIVKGELSKKNQNQGSHAGARSNATQKKKSRQKGSGSRKGKKTARKPKKENWMLHIRSQRKLIRELKDKSLVSNEVYRQLYRKSKGGFFRSRRHIKLYLTEHNLFIKNETEKNNP